MHNEETWKLNFLNIEDVRSYEKCKTVFSRSPLQMKKELIEFMALFQSSSFKSIPKSLFNTDVVFSIVSLVSEDDILLKSGNVVIKKLGI